jgi:Zn-dependent protease with chaperone function
MIQGKQLDWNSEDGMRLKTILQPTIQELRFTLAHELGHLQLGHHFIAPVAIPVFLWWAHKCSLLVTGRIKAAWKQMLIRCGVYSIFTVTFLLAFVGIRWLFEYSADHFAACQGPHYALGGIKAMEKQLEMRKIMAKMTASHKQPETLISLHPPFTARIARLNKILEKRYPFVRKSI